MSACLDDDQLALYADGLADEAQRASIEEHLGRCDSCNQALSHFARGLEVSDEPRDEPSAERYRIDRLIGRGSMGSVYQAHDRVLDRTIALKFLLRCPRGTAPAGEALQHEAQALAKLTHPNVVAVHELGVLDGQSFTAMEFVDGRTLGEWLERDEIDWPEIVDVLVQAARGLHAAHGAKVVHRDIKPSNILVGRDGRVRVVDFGLAKGSGAPASSPADAARMQPFVTSLAGTPAYMAPEVRRHQPATAKSDQYCFCVTAYEALFGHRPGSDAKPSRRGVPRAIVAVLERGLAEDPDDRYPDMGALLEELERARQRKRLRLVAAAVAGAVIAAVAAVVFVAGADEERSPCSGGTDTLASVWNDTERDQLASHLRRRIGAEKAVTDLLRVIDAQTETWLDVHRQTCRATRVLHTQSDAMMDRRMLCLERRLAVLDALLEGLRADELPALDDAWTVASSVMAQDACASSQALVDLAALPTEPKARQTVGTAFEDAARIGTWIDLGRLERAEQSLVRLEAASSELDYLPLAAELDYLRGRLLVEDSELAAARSVFHRALNEAEAGGDLRMKHLIALSLSNVESSRDEFAESKRWLEHAEASAARIGLRDDPLYEADLATHAGALAWREGRYEPALALFQEALDSLEAASPPAIPSMIALEYNVGSIHRTLGQLEQATAHTEAALELARATFGERHLLTADPHFGSGLNLLAAQQPAEALAHWEVATEIWQRDLGPAHAKVGQARMNIGIAHLVMGKSDEAERELGAALDILEAQPEPDPGQLATILGNLASLAYAREDFAAVLEHAQKSVQVLEAVVGPDHPQLGQPLLLLGLARTELGDLDGARAALRRSLSVQEAALGAEHAALAYPLNALADIALRKEAYAEAAALFERASSVSAGDDYVGAAVALGLSQALWRGKRDRPRARVLARTALDRLRASKRVDEDLAKKIEDWASSIEASGD